MFMKKSTLVILMQCSLALAGAQSLQSQRSGTINWIAGIVPAYYTPQQNDEVNKGPILASAENHGTSPIVITVTGTTNDAGCNPSLADIDAALGAALATSDCGTVTLTVTTGEIQASGCGRSQTRTWTGTDGCGNSATASRTATWTVDVTPPVITASGTTTDLGCNPTSSDIEAALGSATVTDNCEAIVTVTDELIQSSGCNRSQTRVWKATDVCGNLAVVSRTVTWIESTSSPLGTVSGANPNVGCNPSAADIDAALGTATANPTCGPVQLTVTTGPVTTVGCRSFQTRHFTATGVCGNFAEAFRSVTWIVDLTAPVIGSTPDITQSADPGLPTASLNIVSPTVTDNCGIASMSATRSDNLSLAAPYPLGVTTIAWTATDSCGNATVRTQTITIIDVEAPIITSFPTPATQCFIPNSNYIIPALAASDNSGPPSISYVITGATLRQGNGGDVSGFFNPGSNNIEWTVTDAGGNSVAYSATLLIDKIDASILDVYAENILPAIGSSNTIYIGYGGTSVTLIANVVGSIDGNSYSYKWTIGAPGGTKIETGPQVTVSPTATTMYYLSIKDQNGCSQTTQVSKQVSVNDIRCGTDKVFMCELSKNGGTKTVCIPMTKVTSEPAGSYLGQCPALITKSGVGQKSLQENKSYVKSRAGLAAIQPNAGSIGERK
jgi:hypothetical protein